MPSGKLGREVATAVADTAGAATEPLVATERTFLALLDPVGDMKERSLGAIVAGVGDEAAAEAVLAAENEEEDEASTATLPPLLFSNRPDFFEDPLGEDAILTGVFLLCISLTT